MLAIPLPLDSKNFHHFSTYVFIAFWQLLRYLANQKSRTVGGVGEGRTCLCTRVHMWKHSNFKLELGNVDVWGEGATRVPQEKLLGANSTYMWHWIWELNQDTLVGREALSKCFVIVGSIAGVVGSKHQVPLPARGLLVKSNVK